MLENGEEGKMIRCSITMMGLGLLWFVCFVSIGNGFAVSSDEVDTPSFSTQTTQKDLAQEVLNRAYELRISGKLSEAAAEWERAVQLDPGDQLRYPFNTADWVHLFVKLGLSQKALEIFKTRYVGPAPNPETLTTDERVAWGERLIFGQPGGSEVPGAIGRAQCSLCHEFGKVSADKKLRAPILAGISTRTNKLLSSRKYRQREKTTQSYAFPGSGIATNLLEYLAESKVCPSCYVVPGFGVKGSDDGESPEPKLHSAPIGLSVDEMILVDSWILEQEGLDLPSAEIMRAAYHKFIEQPVDRAGSIPKTLFLAHLYDLNGDEAKALELLRQHYEGVLRFDQESALFQRRMAKWRENADMFPHLKKRPEVVKQFPNLLQPTDEWRATDLSVENLEMEYMSFPHHVGGQYPRWFPDGNRILYTVCDLEEFCEIWSLDTHNPWFERVLSDAAFGDPSPDRKQLVFIREKKVYIHDLSTGESTMLIDVPPNAVNPPVWNQAGDSIEVMFAKNSSSPCQTFSFNLFTKVSELRPVSPWEQVWMNQGIPENSMARFVGFENFWGKCQVNLPQDIESSTSGWKRWYDGKWGGQSSLARYLVTPRAGFRERWVPLWWVAKNETGALALEHPGVSPVLSPNGRWFAYEYLMKSKDGPKRLGIVVGSFKERVKPLPKYYIDLGRLNRIEPGMQLLVYYGKTLDATEEKILFEEDMAIGGVRVLEVNDRKAVVQQSIFERHIYRANQSPRNNLVLPGDLAVTPDFKQWAPLTPHN